MNYENKLNLTYPMKKLFLIALISMNSCILMSQTSTSPTFAFCNGTKDKDTINSLNFDSCLELISLDKNLAVLSYSIAFLVSNDKDSAYADYSVTGSKTAKEVIDALKKYKPKKIMIEQVKVTDSNGTIKKCPGLVLYVK